MNEKRVTVDGPSQYNGVSVEHPSIIDAIHNLTKQGKPVEYIMRVVGMPQEVVQRHARTVPKE